MSRVFGFGCDGGFDCGSCLGWTKHAGHVIPFAVQPMQEPQSKAISQPKPKNRDMSSCCVGATLPYLSCLRGGISKAEVQEVPKRRPRRPKSVPRALQERPRAPQSGPRAAQGGPRRPERDPRAAKSSKKHVFFNGLAVLLISFGNPFKADIF